jgi:Ca2+-binding RTX toxin-like protein
VLNLGGVATWSPDGRLLLVDTGFESSPTYVLSTADFEPRLLERGGDSHRWSPDGSRVAYVRGERLHVTRVAGPTTTRLPVALFEAHPFAWHPDGRWIVVSTDAGTIAVEVASGRRRVLTRLNGTFDISADGQRLVLSAQGTCGGRGLHVLRWAGGAPARITNRCTIDGTARADRLAGTRERDIIRGLGGDDVIDANPGDLGNVYYRREDVDAIAGGAGDDRLFGRRGHDTLDGGAGDDRLDGGRGADRLAGGAGDDVLDGGRYLDTVSGGAGGDVVRARDGFRDRISCGPGFDRVAADARDVVSRDCERVERR